MLGCYLAPHNTSTLERVIAAIGHMPQGAELLVTGDFNADQSETARQERDETIVTAMATESFRTRCNISFLAIADGPGMAKHGACFAVARR